MVRTSCKANTPKQNVNGKGNKLSKPKSREQSEQNIVKNMRSLFKTLFKQEDVY